MREAVNSNPFPSRGQHHKHTPPGYRRGFSRDCPNRRRAASKVGNAFQPDTTLFEPKTLLAVVLELLG